MNNYMILNLILNSLILACSAYLAYHAHPIKEKWLIRLLWGILGFGALVEILGII